MDKPLRKCEDVESTSNLAQWNAAECPKKSPHLTLGAGSIFSTFGYCMDSVEPIGRGHLLNINTLKPSYKTPGRRFPTVFNRAGVRIKPRDLHHRNLKSCLSLGSSRLSSMKGLAPLHLVHKPWRKRFHSFARPLIMCLLLAGPFKRKSASQWHRLIGPLWLLSIR